MPNLDRVLEPMRDGKWHNLKDICREIGLSEDKLQEIMRFFAGYRFVQLDEKRGKAKLTPPVRAFLAKTGQTNLKASPKEP